MRRADIARLIPRTFFGGWSFGNGWQRGLEHRWCAGGCGLSLDWFQPEFLAVHPNPMCPPCGMKRDATAELESDRRWAEVHVLRSEVPWVTTMPPNPDVIEWGGR